MNRRKIWTVTSLINGQGGLERIRGEEFHLILLDLAMPQFSGLDVAKSLKEDGLIESKNIVVFTA